MPIPPASAPALPASGRRRAGRPGIRPERRRRGDVIAAAVIVSVLLAVGVVLWRTGDAEGTTSRPATTPIAAPPGADGVPVGFTEAWRAPSAATPEPAVVGPAVVTADTSGVQGRDAVTGAVAWSYTRDLPLCTVGGGFPDSDSGRGRVLALFEGHTGYCSELTALHPDTGTRAAARNPDSRPGTRLLGAGAVVVQTGRDYLEVVRSDLVKTLEYGAVPTPAQAGRQPRPGCTYGSVAVTGSRLGVVERCPDETADRLTVLDPTPSNAEKPEQEFSVVLPSTGAVLVALSADRAAVALPTPPRLLLLDRAGLEVGLVPLGRPATSVPTTGITDAEITDPPGGAVVLSDDADTLSWWTGRRTVALDADDLTPVWTVPGTLGPALPYGGGLLVPVPDGVAELDPQRGTVRRTLAVSRADRTAPVRLAAAGGMLLEQRGTELVALRPS